MRTRVVEAIERQPHCRYTAPLHLAGQLLGKARLSSAINAVNPDAPKRASLARRQQPFNELGHKRFPFHDPRNVSPFRRRSS
jgi:hypothetical protein